MDTTDSDIWKIVELFSKVARSAGEIIVSKRMNFSVKEKGGNEIVTTADIEANKLIVETLRKTLPDYGFLSEE